MAMPNLKPAETKHPKQYYSPVAVVAKLQRSCKKAKMASMRMDFAMSFLAESMSARTRLFRHM